MEQNADAQSQHPYHDDRWEFKTRDDVNTARTSREHAVADAPWEHVGGGGHVPSLVVYPKDEADRKAIRETADELEPSLVEVDTPHAGDDRMVFVDEAATEYVENERE